MAINPYITQEYQPQPAPPPPTRTVKTVIHTGRATNRVAMTCAFIGIALGLWVGGIPKFYSNSESELARTSAYTLFHVQVFAALGYWVGWILKLSFTRPFTALLIAMVSAAAGLAHDVWSEGPVSRAVSWPSIPLAALPSIPFTGKTTDLARHQEAGRIQLGNAACSVILPPNWKEQMRTPENCIYTGSTGVAFPGAVGLSVHPKPQQLTIAALQDSIAKYNPGFISFIETGKLTLDGKQAFFIAYHSRSEERRYREVVYVVPGQSKLYQLNVACHEPPTKSSSDTLTRVVNSLRVD